MEVWLDDVTCNGLESSLEQYAHNGFGVVHDCVGQIESAAVKCTESIVYSPSVQYVPSIPFYRPAGHTNISAPEHVPIPVRLYGSTRASSEGLVEIQINGDWKYVCGDKCFANGAFEFNARNIYEWKHTWILMRSLTPV